MMQIDQLVFNPYEVNTYIVISSDGQCAIIDPACCSPSEQAKLQEYIAGNGLSPAWLINTHGHFDHVIGNAFTSRTWQVQSAAHRADLFLMEHAFRQGEIFGYAVEQPPAPTLYIGEGDSISFGDVMLRVCHLPGHSPGSIVLHSPLHNLLIAGDVMFRGSVGRTDLPGGDFDLLMNGIENKLMTLPPDTVVYPGHGPATSIGREKRFNPFLNGKIAK